MEHTFSTPEKTHHTISSTTINKANEDGTITTTEIYTTMSKKTRINYDALIEQNVFTCDDGNEMKYYNAMMKKGELAVFIAEHGNKPICFISVKILEKIVKLMGLTLTTAYDLVTYGFYSMEEYWELNKTVTEYQTAKPNDYVFDYKKEWKLHLDNSEKMNRLIMCDDVLGYVDEEVAKRKGKNMSCRTLKEVSAEKEVDSGEKAKKGSTVKKFRMSQSLKKTTGKKEQDVVVEEEIIEENEFVVKKRKKVKYGNNEVKEIIVEEPKVSEFNDKVETNQTNTNNNNSSSRNVNNDKTKLLENVFIIQPENDNESSKDKDTTFDSQITTTTTVITESSSSTTTTTLPNNNEEQKNTNNTNNNSLKIPKRPPKSNKTKQHTRVLSSSQTNTTQTLTVPHQQTKTKVKSTSKAKNVKVHKMKTNGSRSINIERVQCILCKGLPVRPQQCEKCQSQFCTMCTYELKYPSLCSECGGKLSLVKEKKKAIATFESNITRIVSYKETPKINNTQDNNYNSNITQKDFYNANKDRYVDASWKDKLNTDNNSLTTSNNTVTNTPSTISTLPTNKMDLYSYEKIISTEKNDPIWSICYCPTLLQGKGAIVTGHSSGSIFAWNCDKYIKSKTYLEHSNKVYDIKNIYYTSTYRQIFVSVSEDRSLKIWESTSQHSTISISSIYPIYTLDIHPSNYIIYGDKNKTLYCQYIDIGSKGQLIKDINFKSETTHNSFIWRVKLLSQSSLDNTYVISASENSLQIHKLEINKKRFTLINEHNEAHKGLIHDIIEFGYEHDKFLTCGVDHFIKLWSVHESSPLNVIDYLYDNTIFSLMEVKEKEILICGGYDKQMKLINTKDILTSSQQQQQVQSQYEYKRPESLYKIIPIINNSIFTIASINYGCSSNVYLWGNISKH